MSNRNQKPQPKQQRRITPSPIEEREQHVARQYIELNVEPIDKTNDFLYTGDDEIEDYTRMETVYDDGGDLSPAEPQEVPINPQEQYQQDPNTVEQKYWVWLSLPNQADRLVKKTNNESEVHDLILDMVENGVEVDQIRVFKQLEIHIGVRLS